MYYLNVQSNKCIFFALLFLYNRIFSFKRARLKIMYIAKNTLNIGQNRGISNISLFENVSLLY
jgi:hypothetical protein